LGEWTALQHALVPGQPFSAAALQLLEVILQPGHYDEPLAAPTASRFSAILLMHATFTDQAASVAASYGAPAAQKLPSSRATTRMSPLRDVDMFTAMFEDPGRAPVLAHFPAQAEPAVNVFCVTSMCELMALRVSRAPAISIHGAPLVLLEAARQSAGFSRALSVIIPPIAFLEFSHNVDIFAPNFYAFQQAQTTPYDPFPEKALPPTIVEAFCTLGLFSLTSGDFAELIAVAEALRYSTPLRLGASLAALPNFANVFPLYLAWLFALGRVFT
jgi:hypothetical protein